MFPARATLLILSAGLLMTLPTLADEPKAKEPAPAKSVEDLAKELRKSIVVITTKGREASSNTVGSGFVVAADGLIATNLHVIG